MKKNDKILAFIINTLIISFLSNSYLLLNYLGSKYLIIPFVLLLIFANLMSLLSVYSIPTFRLMVCCYGARCLKVFLWSTAFSVIYHIFIAFYLFPEQWFTWVLSAILCIIVEAIIFWNGMISVYVASVQLGVRHRLTGILCGMIPVLNIIMLLKIIDTVSNEVEFETAKINENKVRHPKKICDTKYPFLLVHGVFFRDFKYLNYWGRIPDELMKNGAVIFYGNHQSAASSYDSGEELAKRIKEIVDEYECDKVNIIAHSKGGLDSRYAVGCFGVKDNVASITTINSPHRGCIFVDYLFNKMSVKVKQHIAFSYNSAMKKFGDTSPDFLAAVYSLTKEKCEAMNDELKEPDSIFCQSTGSKLSHTANGKFPLNFSYNLVNHFDGPNDGLVSEKSSLWGEKHISLSINGKRGISHGDMVDLNRENIPDFDVREFYVQLAYDLKKRGL